ncbi:probable serine/threonine-protein kinase PBL10 [Cornus florida]|uniref:probable serine/threonine-protein kinase PBL10 n=1 Tax=Cornus florida TaxID=4283 RepID=UPI002897A3ED|nr:probable serine/threonine-protein kinase PBL10 [Cornus florida]
MELTTSLRLALPGFLDDGRLNSTLVQLTPLTEGEILETPNLMRFSFSQLQRSTMSFRPKSLFGDIFKGWIDENTFTAAKPGTSMVIAVEILDFSSHPEWLAEINYLGQLHHPNLVKLVRYCLEEGRFLVHEFMPQGSLEYHLFRRPPYVELLSWNLRIKVTLGAAKGLAYLHGLEEKVIYKEFKSSNILFDSERETGSIDFTVKLSVSESAKAGRLDQGC